MFDDTIFFLLFSSMSPDYISDFGDYSILRSYYIYANKS